MLNRRHLRIKVLQALYAYFQSNEENYPKAEKEMMTALERIYDLYLYFLLTFSELKTISENQFEDRKKKIRPTADDLEPNLKLVNNRLIPQLEASAVLKRDANERRVNWEGAEQQEMFKKVLAQLKESETYFSFMSNELDNYDDDRAFLIELFKEDIANSEILYSYFEEENINWIDDIDLVCSMVVKTLKNFTEDSQEILPLYKDKEDEVFFVKELFRKTINLNSENESLIDELTKNWELDRIAKMDVILMKMAITEMQVFSNVPTKVTLNEYIEISKFYSTPKSNTFINGVLDKAIDRLTKDKKINKVGRGLIN
jgi:N utilization substance protein B|tara:strand:- start:22277 stop:23221 length:945 start_codon:yes stop_codon:yes gene_type:complete